MAYDPSEHWSKLHARGDLSSVGQSGLPADLNTWLYRALERRVRWFARRHRVFDGARNAFDVGAGTGYWVRVWHDLGVPRVDGCDLVPEVAERLNQIFADRGNQFVGSDVGAVEPGLPAGRYDVVTVMNVLLHITDDTAFERAVSNVARLVGPGGRLLLVEPILLDAAYERPPKEGATSRARTLAAYRDPLLVAGLEMIEVQGAVALANNPIEAGSRRAYERYVRWWKWIAKRAKSSPSSIRWVGPLMLSLDRIAVAAGAKPSSKIALFVRPEQTALRRNGGGPAVS